MDGAASHRDRVDSNPGAAARGRAPARPRRGRLWDMNLRGQDCFRGRPSTCMSAMATMPPPWVRAESAEQPGQPSGQQRGPERVLTRMWRSRSVAEPDPAASRRSSRLGKAPTRRAMLASSSSPYVKASTAVRSPLSSRSIETVAPSDSSSRRAAAASGAGFAVVESGLSPSVAGREGPRNGQAHPACATGDEDRDGVLRRRRGELFAARCVHSLWSALQVALQS